MKLLVFTMIFPNGRRPHHGVFVKERLSRYRERYDAKVRVVAPVPIAPPVGPFGWVKWRGIPGREQVDGFDVVHPRFPSPPGFGDRWRAGLLAGGVKRCLLREVASFRPDVLDVHFVFPEGAAAARLRPALDRAAGGRLAAVVTARGTDLNLVPTIPTLRPQVARALEAMDHVICVAEALRKVALELGMPPDQVTTLRNGVDIERFTPGERDAARRHTGLPDSGVVVLCVGHLTERKGQHLVLEAFARRFADGDGRPTLALVGDGEQRAALEEQVARLGLERSVVFAGAVAPTELVHWYRAADALVLASSREGWPNVVLEALACGTPVIATRVWGTPEILTGCAAGCLVDASVDGLAHGLGRVSDLRSEAARPWAERHTWDATLDGMHDVFRRVTAKGVA